MRQSIAFAIASAAMIALLHGCGSQTTQDAGKAGVEDRTPTPVTTPSPPPPTAGPAQTRPPETRPIAPPQPAVNPLKDPNNILSKRSIYYEYDSDAIKDEFRPMLQAHAKYLSGNRSAKILIQGNCDERGSREYNIALGQRRADGVKRMLVLMGAPESQLESVSLGEEKPRRVGNSETDYAENRRSDILYGGEY